MKLERSLILLPVLFAIGCSKQSTPSPSPSPPAACVYTVSSATQAATSGGGSFSLTITKTSGTCNWTATSDASWITFSGSATGSDTGTLSVAVAANPASATRTGIITVTWTGGTAQVTVTQAATGCSYTVAPTSQAVPLEGGAFTATVTTSATGCAWTASADVPWLIIASGASGTTTGTITYTAAPNPDALERSGKITVQWSTGSAQVTVTEAPVVTCIYTLSPTSQSVAGTAGSGFSFTVTRNTANGCSWNARTSTPWITLTGATAGGSPGTITYSVAESTVGVARTGTITVSWSGGTAEFTVRQDAQRPCDYSLAPLSEAAPACGATYKVVVTPSRSICQWTASTDVPWISIVGDTANSGQVVVTYNVLPNPGAARSGNFIVTGTAGGRAQLAVSQAAVAGVCP